MNALVGDHEKDTVAQNIQAIFQRQLENYQKSGKVRIIQFPFFSEMQYRRGITTIKLALTYDQNIAYEHCMMLSRASKDRWLLFLDTDEYVRVSGIDRDERSSIASAVHTYVSQYASLDNGNYVQGDRIITELYLDRFDMTSRPSEELGDTEEPKPPSVQSIDRFPLAPLDVKPSKSSR